MFGEYARRRERRRRRQAERALEKQTRSPYDPLEAAQKRQGKIDVLAKESGRRQGMSREAGRKYAKEFLGQEVEGLTPQQRIAMQESANAQIGGEMAGARRRLAAEQGRRGVSGGAAFAQQQELNKAAQEARGQFQRDLTQLESENALKKLAAMFNIEQGTVAQDLLNWQAAQDLLRAEEEDRRLRAESKKGSKKFYRV